MLTLGAGCGDAPPPGPVIPDDLALQVSPTALTFGSVAFGDDSMKSVTLTHVGATGTIRFSVALSPDTGSDFILDSPGKTQLQPGESTWVFVHYRPVGTLGTSGELVIRHNVPPTRETRVTLQALAAYHALAADPDPIDFGDVPVATKKELDVELSNLGTAPVTVTDIQLDLVGTALEIVDGTIVAPNAQHLPMDLAPGARMGLTIRYAPGSDGCDDAVLQVKGKAPSAPTGFEVSGCGCVPTIAVLPTELDFGTVGKNVTKQLALTLSNDGDCNLVVPKHGLVVAASGASSADGFAVVEDATFGATNGSADGIIPAGWEQVVGVVFTNAGGSLGSAEAVLTIHSNSQDHPILMLLRFLPNSSFQTPS